MVKQSEQASLLEEVKLLMQLDHPNIVKVYNLYEDTKYYRIVTEYCQGGELFEKIQEENSFSEQQAAMYLEQILSALVYLHSKDIVHRDIKAENLLFENREPDSPLKLIDFGVSTKYVDSKKMKETLGTAYYIAPEVLL